VLFALVVLLGGCRGCASGRPPIHLNPNMDRQPKVLPQAASAFFYDGAAMRAPVPGTVAREDPPAIDAATTGLGADGQPVAAMPLAATPELIARGADRYRIYCAPCHGDRADGKGMLFERAQVLSGDLLGEKVRPQPDGQIFDTITHGFGLMPGYRHPIPAHDRWAIVAYVRHLQAGGEAP
jgi:mono/diheme cytochrome c family protein